MGGPSNGTCGTRGSALEEFEARAKAQMVARREEEYWAEEMARTAKHNRECEARAIEQRRVASRAEKLAGMSERARAEELAREAAEARAAEEAKEAEWARVKDSVLDRRMW